jgi:HlyD family secretion protein
MKKIIIIACIIILALAVWFFVFKKESAAATKYTTAIVQQGTISITVTATGSLEAVNTVQVGSQISGTIKALHADYNDIVKKGQLLAQIDPEFLNAQVVAAQADLDKANASAKLKKREYERAQSLFKNHLISESDLENAETDNELSQAELKSSEANLDRLKTNLNYATIVSPIDGVVISRDVDLGQTVAASLSAPTLFTIAQDLTKMQVNAVIDEADIGKIEDGQDVIFTVDAYPDKSFTGIVKQIRLAPQIVSNVVSYNVIISVANPDLLLKPGMTANVTVQIARHDNVLKVPTAALKFRPSFVGKKPPTAPSGATAGTTDSTKQPGNGSGGFNPNDSTMAKKLRVWVFDEKRNPRPVFVETGLVDGSFTEVISDRLSAGDTIITAQEGVVASATTNNSSQEVNPFAPKFGPGGAGGRH